MSNEVLLLRTYLLCEVHGFILRSFLFSKRTNNDQSNEPSTASVHRNSEVTLSLYIPHG